MIYTIGSKQSYYKAREEFEKVYKLGKRADGYEGGYAFKTKEDAQSYIDAFYSNRDFIVFPVVADWENDTELSENGLYNNLINDSEIIFED